MDIAPCSGLMAADPFAVVILPGAQQEDCERLCGNKVSDTTVRARRDEWDAAGVFDALVAEAIAAYDKIIRLDLSEVAVDGSLHKSPAGSSRSGWPRPRSSRRGCPWRR